MVMHSNITLVTYRCSNAIRRRSCRATKNGPLELGADKLSISSGSFEGSNQMMFKERVVDTGVCVIYSVIVIESKRRLLVCDKVKCSSPFLECSGECSWSF